MRKSTIVLAAMLTAMPALALAQAGPTQSTDGLGTGGHSNGSATSPANSLPAGSENANTGPQSRPAFPTGTNSANPGAAFIGTQPTPSTGPVNRPPGDIATTTTAPNGQQATRPGGPPTEERAAVTPPK